MTHSKHAPPNLPCATDLPPPDAFSAADAKDAAPLADLVGEYLARCAYSKSWQLREAALARVTADLESGALALSSRSGECRVIRVLWDAQGSAASSMLTRAQVLGHRVLLAVLQLSIPPSPACLVAADALRALSRAMLLRCLKDKVPAVVSAALRTLRALVAAAADGAPPRELQAALSDLLPVLVEKAADLNQRTREQTTEALVALGSVPAAGLASATAAFLRAVKPNTAWKVVLGRCGGGWLGQARA